MEPMTALVLAFQILALFSIAGALLIYLICKVRDDSEANWAQTQPQNRIVLVTSADTALGLQICTHLAQKGCRVFAGMKDASEEALTVKLLSGWMRLREYSEEPILGSIIPMQLDVTREDVLREATVAIGAHLNAGERGIAAVINTSGSVYRGRVDSQDVMQWEHMLRTNILGSLRVAKAFVGFLRPTRGRLIYLGASNNNFGSTDGLVAYNASRMAVEKCAEELRAELKPSGVSVVTLDTTGLTAESLYKAPVAQVVSNDEGAAKQYCADILSVNALQVIERALWDVPAQQRYQLTVPQGKYTLLPCRSTTRNFFRINSIQKV